MKDRYISLMDKTLSAYSDSHIRDYFASVKCNGLTEHGFPRLTANIGILIAHKKREDLIPLFCEMMSFCCENIPNVKAANDFSVREIIFCIMALEKKDIISDEKISEWKRNLSYISPQMCYDKFATAVSDKVNNWACFTAVSEFMRGYIGLCDSSDFVELQIANQLKYMDENGMYREPHDPIVYDLVPRILFSVLLHFGYRGKYYEEIDSHLKKAGLLTLKMQSVTGEIPYGGRSNQFIFNEALLAIVFEYESVRYYQYGDIKTASSFKLATKKALDCIENWLSEENIRHVKNYFPLDSRYGCESYAYFDKYMITVASYLYCAYLLCDDSINECYAAKEAPCVASTSAYFHKHFMRAGGYFLEFDTYADKKYECSGLGRIHKTGAPSALCISLPCTSTPKYKNNAADGIDLSLCAGAFLDGKLVFATECDSVYDVTALYTSDEAAFAEIKNNICGEKTLFSEYKVDETGIYIIVRGIGDVAFMLPAFYFDGEAYTKISVTENILTVEYKGCVCKYMTNGNIVDLEQKAYNRNGHYRAFCATAKDDLYLKIEICDKI